MQYRMKTHPLSDDKINQLLAKSQIGSLATVNADGSPYVTPIHFVMFQQSVFIHGLLKGQKIDNIKNNPIVSMTIYEMQGLLLDPNGNPCNTNTEYQSIVLDGHATLLNDQQLKKEVLCKIVAKYTPNLSRAIIPDAMVKSTAVIQIEIQNITGKHYG